MTAVDYYTGEVLIDSLVWPTRELLHTNQRFSGVSWVELQDSQKRVDTLHGRDGARREIWKYVGRHTRLIVHDGRDDMVALRWFHHRIIDSHELETRRVAPKTPRDLNQLTFSLLGRRLGQNRRGLDSLEQVMACRDLVHWFTRNMPDDLRREPVGRFYYTQPNISDFYTEWRELSKIQLN
jgi:RNA exonuclease 1